MSRVFEGKGIDVRTCLSSTITVVKGDGGEVLAVVVVGCGRTCMEIILVVKQAAIFLNGEDLSATHLYTECRAKSCRMHIDIVVGTEVSRRRQADGRGCSDALRACTEMSESDVIVVPIDAFGTLPFTVTGKIERVRQTRDAEFLLCRCRDTVEGDIATQNVCRRLHRLSCLVAWGVKVAARRYAGRLAIVGVCEHVTVIGILEQGVSHADAQGGIVDGESVAGVGSVDVAGKILVVGGVTADGDADLGCRYGEVATVLVGGMIVGIDKVVLGRVLSLRKVGPRRGIDCAVVTRL